MNFKYQIIKDKIREVFGLDIRSLAFMRIGVAAILIFDLILRARTLIAHYSDSGVLPRAAVLQAVPDPTAWSLNFISGYWQFQLVFFVVTFLFFVALLLGYKTRWSTLISWILLVSIQNRNPLLVQGSDHLLTLVLMWGFFMHWGDKYSVDSALSGKSNNKTNQIFNVATFAYFIQIILLYLTAAIYKSFPIWHQEGSALFYILGYEASSTILGRFLFFNASKIFLQMMTWGTWWLELIGGFLLIVPFWNHWFRAVAIISFFFFHLGIGLTMNIGIFAWVDIVLLFAFIPGQFWDWLGRRLFQRQNNLTLYYDQDCGFCKNSVLIIKTFLFLKDVNITPAHEHQEIFEEMNNKNSWIIVHGNNKFYRFDGFLEILSVSPVFRFLEPLLKLKPFKLIGEKIYTSVAKHRKKTCTVAIPKVIREPEWASFALQFLAGFLLFIVVFWNLSQVTDGKVRFPAGLQPLTLNLKLNQRWDMFAPGPDAKPFWYTNSFWYTAPGKLRNGLIVDVLKNGDLTPWDKSKLTFFKNPNYRWRNFLSLMFSYNTFRPYYAKYLCDTWNHSHMGDEILDNVEIMVVYKHNDFETRTQELSDPPISLFKYQCFNGQ